MKISRTYVIETKKSMGPMELKTANAEIELSIAGLGTKLTIEQAEKLQSELAPYGLKNTSAIRLHKNDRDFKGDCILISHSDDKSMVTIALFIKGNHGEFSIFDIDFTREECEELRGYSGPLEALLDEARSARIEDMEEIAI